MLYRKKVRELNFKPVNETKDENWKTRIIGQKRKNLLEHNIPSQVVVYL